MANQTGSQRILKWLKGNQIPLGALTSHDVAALFAATEIAALWVRGDRHERPRSAQAFRLVVEQMQDSTKHMAYHAIAMVAEWDHRAELWRDAALPVQPLASAPNCKFAPKTVCQKL